MFCPELSGGLIQSVDQLGLTKRRSKDQVADPHAGSLMAQAPQLLFLELDNQLVHNLRSKGFIG
jgi:hypothetical protein